jgi:Protein of unknown function (DUF1616)
MHLDNYRMIFVAAGLIGVLLFASPTIGLLIRTPSGQHFSELYILGPSRTLGDIPFNIKAGVTYSVYLGVVNQMGSSSYYTSLVKLGNNTHSLPSPILGTPSSLPVLYEYNSFISDGATWEAPLTFQVNQLTFQNNVSQLAGIVINGIEFPIKQTSIWNSTKTGYYYNLFVELMIYNTTSGTSQYHNRFVSLVLNMTQ